MAIIVVDPGHGGTTNVDSSSWNNATGPGGTLEKAINLAIGLALRAELTRRGHMVTMTREDDSNLSLAARAAVARDARADVFLSLHCNGWPTPKVQGTETWIHTRYEANSRSLASLVQGSLVSATGLSDRGVKENDFGVLNPDRHDSHTAACLAEVSFLTDPNEEDRLNDTAYQQRVAEHLADAIDQYVDDAHTRFSMQKAVLEDAVARRSAQLAPSEAELWQRQQATAEAALRFAIEFLGCRMGGGNDEPLDDRAVGRLRTIVRAVSIVESQHGTQGANRPARDPLQCANPGDAWWRELTGQTGNGSRFIRGKGLTNLWANEINSAAEARPGFDPDAAFSLLANARNGHRNRAFKPPHSYVWGIIYLLHRINTTAGQPSYACGDLSRTRLIDGAVAYNGGGVADYRQRIERALRQIGDLPEAAQPTGREIAGSLMQQVTEAVTLLPGQAPVSRADFKFDTEGRIASVSFDFAQRDLLERVAAYEIKVIRGSDKGRLLFTYGGVSVDSDCWWDLERKITAGTYQQCSATRMATKEDSVTGDRRPGIYLPTALAPDTGNKTIFIHEGNNASWSDGCIVLPRDQMMRIWNVIPKDAQNVTVSVTDT